MVINDATPHYFAIDLYNIIKLCLTGHALIYQQIVK